MNFLELVKARYSARKYANRPVEAEKLDYIMECVRFAPSAVNFQPWRFRIVTDEAVLKALYSCYKREWLATAPCIIVACVDHNESWHRRADNMQSFSEVSGHPWYSATPRNPHTHVSPADG